MVGNRSGFRCLDTFGTNAWFSPTDLSGYLAYRIRQNAAMIACTTIATLLSVWALWFSRAYLFEGIIRLLCFRLPFVSDRLRIRWLVQVLDRRCQLAGFARPRSVPPRDWLVRNLVLEKAPWASSIDRFFSEADRLTFGSGSALTSEGQRACAELWSRASTFCLRRLRPSS